MAALGTGWPKSGLVVAKKTSNRPFAHDGIAQAATYLIAIQDSILLGGHRALC
jgi:hypothetical protein